jgi:hypothetical protein
VRRDILACVASECGRARSTPPLRDEPPPQCAPCPGAPATPPLVAVCVAGSCAAR